jgi:hypothetical protein
LQRGTGGCAMVDPDVGQCPMVRPYRASAISQRNSLIKLDAAVAG